MLIGEHERKNDMKIKRFAASVFAIGALATSVFLASCGDADGDGKVPMNDNDNKNVVDEVKKMADDVAEKFKSEDHRKVPENDINKPGPDSANINI